MTTTRERERETFTDLSYDPVTIAEYSRLNLQQLTLCAHVKRGPLHTHTHTHTACDLRLCAREIFESRALLPCPREILAYLLRTTPFVCCRLSFASVSREQVPLTTRDVHIQVQNFIRVSAKLFYKRAFVRIPKAYCSIVSTAETVISIFCQALQR